jgi:hypothetical protein
LRLIDSSAGAPVRAAALLLSTMAVACNSAPPVSTIPTAVGATAERIAQVVDDNRLRVVVVNNGDIVLGQEADPLGNPLNRLCTAEPVYFGGLPIVRRARELAADESRATLDVAAVPSASELSSGGFRLYMRTLEVDASASATFSVVDASNTTRVNRYEVIREWSRYTTRQLRDRIPTPHIAGADVGFAVRMVMIVDILTTDTETSANVGIGTLDAALAMNRSEISVSYQVIGATYALLPAGSTRISNTEQFYEAQQEFHGLIRDLSAVWEAEAGLCRTCGGEGEARPACCRYAEAIRGANPPPAMVIQPAVLAYYVQGPGIGTNVRRIDRATEDCNLQWKRYCRGACESAYLQCLNAVDAERSRLQQEVDRNSECGRRGAANARQGSAAPDAGPTDET